MVHSLGLKCNRQERQPLGGAGVDNHSKQENGAAVFSREAWTSSVYTQNE
jgi:hypothetical protein